MGHLFPGGTKPPSGSEFRSRVVFCLDCGFALLPEGEG
jgi:hypothetical protein